MFLSLVRGNGIIKIFLNTGSREVWFSLTGQLYMQRDNVEYEHARVTERPVANHSDLVNSKVVVDTTTESQTGEGIVS